MGLLSDRSKILPRVAAVEVTVIRVIEMKPSLGIAHAPGVVAVLDGFPSPDPQKYVGRSATISTPTNQRVAVTIEAVRDHAATISFFFRGLNVADLPVGSRITFEE